jgi:hemoglobin/transferrin/lactoferrin receptor protein
MYQHDLNSKTTLNAGLRYNYGWMNARFDNRFFPFPYQDAEIKDAALTGNLGVAYRPAETWQLNATAGTGFRLPNVDDVGKLFESAPGNLTVPNPNLKSEYAWNFEVGAIKQKAGAYRFELNLFYSLLTNAIVRRPFLFNGEDSIVYDGVLSRVEALQNIGKATVYGLQFVGEYWIIPSLSIYSMANFTKGTETDDVDNEQVPLRHAPPFFGRTGVKWKKGKLAAECWSEYNSEISADDLAPSEQSKINIYATDENGRPYSPGWYTINARASYQLKKWMLTLGYENISNQRYRPYSSGIVAPGSNFIASVRFGW